jgi:hypothetical protein
MEEFGFVTGLSRPYTGKDTDNEQLTLERL